MPVTTTATTVMPSASITIMINASWVVGALPEEGRAVREAVFGREMGMRPEEYLDDRDETAWHLVAREDGRVVGTARVCIRGAAWEIGPVAVLRDARNRQVGDLMVRLCVFRLQQMPQAPILARVPEAARSLFARIGFVPTQETGWMEFPVGGVLQGSCCHHDA